MSQLLQKLAQNLEHEGLSIRTELSQDAATLIWKGFSQMRTPEVVLEPFLRERVAELKGRTLTVDFRQFEYMNSATQSPILQFFKSLDRNQIPTRVLYNMQVEWQRTSYQCMKVLFRSMPNIQFECL
jgi:hypothetical protein